jgi:hypothetical protein
MYPPMDGCSRVYQYIWAVGGEGGGGYCMLIRKDGFAVLIWVYIQKRSEEEPFAHIGVGCRGGHPAGENYDGQYLDCLIRYL